MLGLPGSILVAVSVVSNLLMLTGPIFMLQVYDRVLASRSVPTLVALTLLVVVLYAFIGLLDTLRSRVVIRIGGTLAEKWAPRALEAVMRQKLARTAAGPDPVRDLDVVQQSIVGGGPLALLDLPWLPLYTLLVALLHPWLGALCAAGALALVALAATSEVGLRKPSQAVVVAQVRRQQVDDGVRTNADSIRAMGMAPDIQAIWQQRSAELSAAQQIVLDRSTTFSSSTKSFRFFLQSAVLALGAFLVINGEATAGVMIGASMIAGRALAPIEALTGQWRPLLAAREAWKRLGPIVRVTDPGGENLTLPAPSDRLTVSDLATGPSRQTGALVSGISFELSAGEGLGILGLSGSGKSSLIRALVGIWPTMQGEVRLDGALASQYDPVYLGQAIGYLPQSVELFAGTIAQNIARFRPAAADADIFSAARAANVHDLIVGLKDGYRTQVGEGGLALSAGQRQRIGLARALFGDPFLIVLDEPNSNLDAAGDEALTRAVLSARARKAIVIIVSHRPGAIAGVDKLLFIQGGRQARFGKKQDVLKEISAPASGSRRRAVHPPRPPVDHETINA